MTTPHRTFRTPSVTSSRLHIHNEPTDEIRTIVQILKPNIERMMRCQLTDVEAVQFSSQHVIGENYFIKVRAQHEPPKEEYLHIKVHKGPGPGAMAELTNLERDKELDDNILFF